MKNDLTAERLRSLLHYDPETGIFTRLVTSGRNRWLAGSPAGTPHSGHGGYTQIRIANRRYYAHRLAFLYMTGAIPAYVDHVNCDRSDTRWANLRPASQTENNRNGPVRRSNKLGIKGVYRHRRKFVARITVDRMPIEIGKFDTAEEAGHAYREAAAQFHGDFANVG